MWRITGKLNEHNENFEFEWEFPNFSSVSKNIRSLYHSPSFNFADNSWHVVLYTGLRYYLPVYLYNETECQIPVSFAFSIKDIEGGLIGTQEKSASTSRAFSGFPTFFSLSSLEERKNYLIPSDTLTIVCKMKQSYDVERTITDVLEANILIEEESGLISEQMTSTGNDDTLETFYTLYYNAFFKKCPWLTMLL